VKVGQRGVVTAFVEEIDASRGRIKVRYRARDEDLISPWAPIASPLSGKSRGALFMPEKGDEVLVGFEDGDFCNPYVLGFLWNGEHVSPENKPENRVIITPGGHQLRFEDKKGDKRVVLKSSGGRSLTLEDKPGSGKIEIKSKQHSVTMTDEPTQGITIQAGEAGAGVTIDIKVTPPSVTVMIGPSNRIEIGPSGITVTTPATINVNCMAANITASGATNLTTGMLNVTAGATIFSGVVMASAVIAQAVVSPLYSPGVGNIV